MFVFYHSLCLVLCIFFKVCKCSTIRAYIWKYLLIERYKLKWNTTSGIRIIYNHQLSPSWSPVCSPQTHVHNSPHSWPSAKSDGWAHYAQWKGLPMSSVTGPKETGRRIEFIFTSLKREGLDGERVFPGASLTFSQYQPLLTPTLPCPMETRLRGLRRTASSMWKMSVRARSNTPPPRKIFPLFLLPLAPYMTR